MRNIKHIILFIFLPLVSVFGQNDLHLALSEDDSIWYTEEIIVTATKTESNVFDVPRSAVIVGAEQLKRQSISRMPDALQELPEITVQRTTLGGGSPILRGLVGRYVLVLVDGIRLNNSTYRSGPHQYFNTIDPNLVDRIEIVNGPGSVLYGSDALGGVINIITKKTPQNTGLSLLSDTRVSSADGGVMQYFQAGYRAANFSVSSGLSLKKFNDLHGGDNIGLQAPTGYQQWDGVLLADYTFSGCSKLTFSYQTTNQNEVPRYDRIAAGRDAKNVYDPQKRQLAHIAFSQNFQHAFIDFMKIDLSYQQQAEGSNIISQKDLIHEIQERIDTRTYGIGISFNSYLGTTHLLTYGAEYYYDRISSSRDTLNLNTNKKQSGLDPYPGSPTYQSTAFYIQDEIFLPDFSIIAGLRYSFFHFQAHLSESALRSELGTVTSNPQTLSGNLNITWKLIRQRLNLFGGVSQGFRAPNSNDLIAVGNVSNAGIEIPNPNLKPEKSSQYELGFKSDFTKWGLNGSVYYMAISDLIQRRSVGVADGLTLLRKENFSRAGITGLHMEGFYVIHPTWHIQGGINWTLGENFEQDKPLSMIPPLRGKVSLKYQPHHYWGEFLTVFSATQDRLSPIDKLSPRIGPDGTSGFIIFSLRGGFSISNHVELTAGVENLLNETYKIHGSGIYSAGRNVFFGLRLTN
jgi:outer membrane receptor protein involved in Fe transport